MDNELEKTKENSETKTEQKNDIAAMEARIKQLESENKHLESENGKLKQAQTNASADASEWKKKYQSTLSEGEKKQQEQESAYAAMQEKLATLEAERNIANYTAELSASDIGMDAESAKYVAEALNSGETEKVFDGIRKFIASHDKAMAEKAILNNPMLQSGNTTKTVTREEFNNMGYREMVAFKSEHPDLFAEFTKQT